MTRFSPHKAVHKPERGIISQILHRQRFQQAHCLQHRLPLSKRFHREGQGATAAQAINRDLFEESIANHSLRRLREAQLEEEKTVPEEKK